VVEASSSTEEKVVAYTLELGMIDIVIAVAISSQVIRIDDGQVV
jgi:hypothetical protein